jgi:rhodanese-related sulfurtransferase
VREPAEFPGRLGHIASAVNIPLGELPGRRREPGNPRHPVVVVCRTDKRSAKAAAILHANGIDRAVVLEGGMEAWNASLR